MTLMDNYKDLQVAQHRLRSEILHRCETPHQKATQEDRQLFLANELLKLEPNKVWRIKILRMTLALDLHTAKRLDDLIEWANSRRPL